MVHRNPYSSSSKFCITCGSTSRLKVVMQKLNNQKYAVTIMVPISARLSGGGLINITESGSSSSGSGRSGGSSSGSSSSRVEVVV